MKRTASNPASPPGTVHVNGSSSKPTSYVELGSPAFRPICEPCDWRGPSFGSDTRARDALNEHRASHEA